MATLKYNNVGIRAISACVPRNIVRNKDLDYLIDEEGIEKTINNIGVEERRVVDNDVCASDLCYAAALKLMEDNDVDPNSIDVLLFMSQTADYRIPATAPILQHRLGLSIDTLCLDLSLGCSGYVYALSTAYAYASLEGINRVLLLDGETFSKIVNKHDKVNWPLYGDGATATLIEKGNFGESTFVLKSDGSGKDSVIIRDGMRNMVSEESCIEKIDVDGNIRSGLEIFMDGMAIFNFAMKRVPRVIKEITECTGVPLDCIDWFVFHQSNKFMTDFFVRKLKIDANKVPYSIQKYGNTSSTSIPLTIVSELIDKQKDGDCLVMSGYGAGLSWGTTLLTLNGCKISPVIEY